jgi:hypothetical protein
MFCNRCGAEAQEGQRFCASCGAALQVTAAELYDFASDEPDDLTAAMSPPATSPSTSAGSAPSPAVAPAVTAPTPITTPTSVVTADRPRPGTTTDVIEIVPYGTDDHLETNLPPFRLGVTASVALLAAVATVVSVFANVVSISTDAVDPEFAVGEWQVDDFGTNLAGAGLLTVVALVVGAVGAGFRQRWGAGLAGGAGLALTGWAVLVVGLAEQPLQLADAVVSRPSPVEFSVLLTRDLGYWVLGVAAILGLLTFVVSLGSVRSDGRWGLNPWIAALGAVAALMAAAGPLIPEGTASFENNWSSAGGTVDQPTAFLVGRVLQVGLLAFSGVIGFLLVRRYGLGLAIGGMTAAVWLSVTTLFGIGNAPVGPAYANPGSVDVDVHAVTIAGMTALVGFAIVAVIASIELAAREP